MKLQGNMQQTSTLRKGCLQTLYYMLGFFALISSTYNFAFPALQFYELGFNRFSASSSNVLLYQGNTLVQPTSTSDSNYKKYSPPATALNLELDVVHTHEHSHAANRRLTALLESLPPNPNIPYGLINPEADPNQGEYSTRVEEIAALLHALDNMDSPDTPPTSMMIVTAEPHAGQCSSSLGTHLVTKSYKNKVDYCNLHDCTVRYLLESWPAPASPPHMLSQLMRSHPSVQWFLWMDTHTLFTNLSFSFPLQTYAAWGKHFVIPAQASSARAAAGADHDGMQEDYWRGGNPLILLVQNSKWSRDLLGEWTARARVLSSSTTQKRRSKARRQQQAEVEVDAGAEIEHKYKSDVRSEEKELLRRQAAQVRAQDAADHQLAAGKRERSEREEEEIRTRAALRHVLQSREKRRSKAEEKQSKVLIEDGLYLHGRQELLVKSYEKLDEDRRTDEGAGDLLNEEGIMRKRTLSIHEEEEEEEYSAGRRNYKWPFLLHFGGCNFCSGAPLQAEEEEEQVGVVVAHNHHHHHHHSNNKIPEACISAFQRAFYYADNQLLALAGMQHRRLYSTLA